MIEDDPSCVEAFVTFLYDLNYANEALTSGSSEIHFHVRMSVFADKYNVPGLRAVAMEKFESCIEALRRLKSDESAPYLNTALTEAASEVYDYPDATKEIRHRIVDFAVDKKEKLLCGTTDISAFEKLMRTCPELATNIVKALLGNYTPLPTWKLYRCKSCGDNFSRKLSENQCLCPYCGRKCEIS